MQSLHCRHNIRVKILSYLKLTRYKYLKCTNITTLLLNIFNFIEL